MLDIPKASQFEVRSVMHFSTSGTYSLYGLPTLQSPLAKIWSYVFNDLKHFLKYPASNFATSRHSVLHEILSRVWFLRQKEILSQHCVWPKKRSTNQLEGPLETDNRRKLYLVFKCILINGLFFLDFHIERGQKKMQSKIKSFFQRGTVLIIFKNMTSVVNNFERLKC